VADYYVGISLDNLINIEDIIEILGLFDEKCGGIRVVGFC